MFNLFRLWKSSQYIERNGWVFLSKEKWEKDFRGNAAWGKDPCAKLLHLDPTLDLKDWRDDQMVPEWDYPEQEHMRGYLVDLRHGVIVRTIVSEPPNSMMVLAIHGCGITYMLLHRPGKTKGVARKVGMASLPPFTLGFTNQIGALKVKTVISDTDVDITHPTIPTWRLEFSDGIGGSVGNRATVNARRLSHAVRIMIVNK
ncbi:hypothetical protein MPER_09642 [Moniliophthora perniciosa FA553]|nr:hypothetical protein MPER_09642 [Moniliophthora perniciosa FA553]